MEALRQRVELEIESAPTPALAAGWIIVLDQLEGLRASKKTPASLIGALKMMNQLGGVSTEQASLLSYMNARWPQEKPTLRAVPEEG